MATPLALLVVFSTPLIEVSSYLWTEPLYVLETFFLLLVLTKFVRQGDALLIVVATLLAIAASLTRYIGVVNIGVLGIVVFLGLKMSFAKRTAVSLTACLVAAVPLILWAFRNYSIDGTWLGPRVPSVDNFGTNIWRVLDALFSWFLPDRIGVSIGLILLAAVILFSFILILNARPRKPIITECLSSFPVWLYALYIVAYTTFLVWSSTRYAYDAINSRLLVPIYVPLLVLIAFGLHTLFRSTETRKTHNSVVALSSLALVALVTFLGYRTVTIVRDNYVSQTKGGYNSLAWRESETIAQLRTRLSRMMDFPEAQQPVQVYTDIGPAIGLHLFDYIIAGEIQVTQVPRTLNPRSFLGTHDVLEFKGIWPDTVPAYFVWFRDRRSFAPDELDMIASLTLLADYNDGQIYIVEDRNSPF